MTSTVSCTYTREIPLGFNGYVVVAQPAARLRADEVRVGDVLILDGYVSQVSGIDKHDLFPPNWSPSWDVLHIKGDVNIIRFPSEILSVIRSSQEQPDD